MLLAPPEVLTPEDEELARKKASLAAIEVQLADRELELAACRADLNHFERRVPANCRPTLRGSRSIEGRHRRSPRPTTPERPGRA